MSEVKDREKLFTEPLSRAGQSPSTFIIFLYLATIGFSSQLRATSTHWMCLMQWLCPHQSHLSSMSLLPTENNTCKHLWGRNNRIARLKKKKGVQLSTKASEIKTKQMCAKSSTADTKEERFIQEQRRRVKALISTALCFHIPQTQLEAT